MADFSSTGTSEAPLGAQSQDRGRLKALDLIRGVAILGILPVNMTFFSGPGFDPLPSAETGQARVVSIVVMLLFEGKMVTLLALLFGAGLALQANRAHAAGRRFAPYYWRRMAVLCVIGLVHALLLSHMDILTSYAVAGVMALLFVHRADRTLLRWAGAFLTWCYSLPLLAVIIVALVGASEFQNGDSPEGESPVTEQAELSPEDDALSAIENLFTAENEIRIFRDGSFGQLVVHRAIYLGLLALIFVVWGGWYVLACMLIGMSLIRRGIFHPGEPQRPRFRKWIVFGLTWGVLCHVAATVAYLRSPDGMVYWCLLAFGMLPLAIAYLSLLTLWAQTERFQWLQNRLREVGRLALSNYLLQSVLCGFAFFGHGLGLYGKFPPAANIGIALAIWTIQLLLSRCWLARFQVGPAEWLWRSVTEGRRHVPDLR